MNRRQVLALGLLTLPVLSACKIKDFLTPDNLMAVLLLKKQSGNIAAVYRDYVLQAGGQESLDAVQGNLVRLIELKEDAKDMDPARALITLVNRREIVDEIKRRAQFLQAFAIQLEKDTGKEIPHSLVLFWEDGVKIYNVVDEAIKAGDRNAKLSLAIEYMIRIGAVVL